ncbi:MAG: hypothetical protein KBC84_11655, partial [Proteobacteria bacterium]|nr:hypothetical protein [Pseudomonadota bacterium]
MKQAVKLPTLAELDSLLNENYWKADNTELPKELLTLKKAAANSLESLAEAAKKLNAKTSFHTPKPFLAELCTLIIAAHQNDAKALRLYAEMQFKVNLWNREQALALAIQSQDTLAQNKAYLELGFFWQQSAQEMRYEQALGYFSQVIKLGCLRETPLA